MLPRARGVASAGGRGTAPSSFLPPPPLSFRARPDGFPRGAVSAVCAWCRVCSFSVLVSGMGVSLPVVSAPLWALSLALALPPGPPSPSPSLARGREGSALGEKEGREGRGGKKREREKKRRPETGEEKKKKKRSASSHPSVRPSVRRRPPAREGARARARRGCGAAAFFFPLGLRPQIRRGDPLNLSILVSGGKETNEDSLSNGERRGKSPAPNPRPAVGRGTCGVQKPPSPAALSGDPSPCDRGRSPRTV